MIKTQFLTDDIFVFRYRIKFNDELQSEEDFAAKTAYLSHVYKPYYKMIFVNYGDFDVINGTNISQCANRSLFFAPPNKSLYLKQNEKGFFDYIFIAFMPTIFHNEFNYKEALQPFDLLNDEERFQIIDEYKFNDGEQAINSLKYAIANGYNYFHISSHLKFIISQLYFGCNKHFNDGLAESDSLYVNVINFITNHFTEPLKLSDLEEKFNISASTINKIVKHMTSFTFLEYLTGLRLKKAEELLETTNLSAEKIATLSGFNYYSSFYRAYKKKHGQSPNKN